MATNKSCNLTSGGTWTDWPVLRGRLIRAYVWHLLNNRLGGTVTKKGYELGKPPLIDHFVSCSTVVGTSSVPVGDIWRASFVDTGITFLREAYFTLCLALELPWMECLTTGVVFIRHLMETKKDWSIWSCSCVVKCFATCIP